MDEAIKTIHWRNAMQEEMRALLQNHTWEVVERKPDIKPIGSRWVFYIKYNSDGSLERYKTRLVAKDYTQSYRIDYKDTFTPIAKLNPVRILISLAVNLDWELR